MVGVGRLRRDRGAGLDPGQGGRVRGSRTGHEGPDMDPSAGRQAPSGPAQQDPQTEEISPPPPA